MVLDSTWKLKGLLFFFHASATMLVSFLPVYFQDLGLTAAEIGTLLAVGPAAAIVAQPFWGYMSDRLKTIRKILLLCLLAALLVGFVLFQIQEFILLLPFIFILFSFTSPAGGLGDSLAQKISVERSVSFGSIRMWGSLGFGIASLIGGYILAWIGIGNIYYVYGACVLLAIIFAYFSPDSKPAARGVTLLDATRLMKNKALLLFLAVIFSVSLTHRMNDAFIGLYIIELGGDESLIGLAWFIGVITEAAVFAFSIYWLRHFHALTLIAGAAFLYALRWSLMSLADGPTFILFLQVLHGLSFGVLYLTSFQYVARIIPKELESTGHLLFISVFFGISGVIGSMLGGQLINYFGMKTLYIVMAALAAIGFISSFFYRRFILNHSKVLAQVQAGVK